MDQIEINYRDNDPDNDYFQAKIGADNDIYINLVTPLSMEQAANLLKVSGVTASINNNIYTYQPEDARKVIEYAGGVAGLAKGGINNVNKAECHAFDKSYEGFDKNLNMFNLNNLILSPNVKPGVYYWHYHFNGKESFPGAGKNTNIKHIFFGIPIIVTQNDIDKYNINGGLNAGQMENYEMIRNNFERSKSLKR